MIVLCGGRKTGEFARAGEGRAFDREKIGSAMTDADSADLAKRKPGAPKSETDDATVKAARTATGFASTTTNAAMTEAST